MRGEEEAAANAIKIKLILKRKLPLGALTFAMLSERNEQKIEIIHSGNCANTF